MDLSNPATLASISSSITRPSMPRPLKNLYKGEPMALGITQILIGILEIAFGLVIVIADRDHFPHTHIVNPYWTGIPYIISGSLSVAAAKDSKLSVVKGMLGMNVVSAVAAGIGIVILSVYVAYPRYHYMCDSYYTEHVPEEICHEAIIIPHAVMFNMSVILLVFTILEFVIAITGAAFGCASICRNAYSETTVVVFQNTDQGAPPAFPGPAKVDEVP
ncbi:membrane-spanning 4-domains subfamily A member 15-like [Eublepharis macularius]|uniref:Membrane-spanning 4-domains subfamily A member 15-like n=1 Tax=Eublepharis macularius TaxID=481883 RepID=A0AA97KIC1_EUBMA|nr:membrane-spanning 4-domains subfamily A member 15-like [Eublepharis macularius]